MATTYYLISDLHIGGDEQLGQVDCLDELLALLGDLEASDEDAELIINGDAFGLWEFTEVEGPAKFDALVERYPELFAQLRSTGERAPVTLIPGNHDYELAAYDEYVDLLAKYNVTLEQTVSIERPVGKHVLHVEHGMQEDPNNRIPDFGTQLRPRQPDRRRACARRVRGARQARPSGGDTPPATAHPRADGAGGDSQ